MLHSHAVRNPFAPFWSLHRDLDRFFTAPEAELGWAGDGFSPSIEVERDDGGLTIYAEIPGVAPEQLQVEVEGDVLTIAGERAASDTEAATQHRSERRYGKFSRSFRLAADYDSETIQAEHRNGILTLRIAKRAAAKPRQISVRAS